jgi:hypothetical protein
MEILSEGGPIAIGEKRMTLVLEEELYIVMGSFNLSYSPDGRKSH